MIVIVIVFCRYALHECGAVPSSLQCDPRFDHIQHMLQSAPLGIDSSDHDQERARMQRLVAMLLPAEVVCRL